MAASFDSTKDKVVKMEDFEPAKTSSLVSSTKAVNKIPMKLEIHQLSNKVTNEPMLDIKSTARVDDAEIYADDEIKNTK